MKTSDDSRNWFLLNRALKLLTAGDRRKLISVFVLQVLLGLLDLLGVALVGLLGALTVSGIQSRNPGGQTSKIIEILGLSNLRFQNQAAILGISAGAVLISRTFLSIYTSRRTLYFLSRKGSEISKNLIASLFRRPLAEVYSRTSQETLYAVTTGVTQITVGILGTALNLSADTLLVLIMSIGLFVVEPVVAIVSTVFFGVFVFVLYYFMKNKTYRLGQVNTQLTVLGSQLTLEALVAYREATVRGTRQKYANSIGEIRVSLSNTLAELAFMPNISKYAVESALVLGTLVLSATQFYLYDASHAIATLTIFMASGSRIAPAILRIQQGALQVRGAAASALPTLNLVDNLKPLVGPKVEPTTFKSNHDGFVGKVNLQNVCFRYPNSEIETLKNINLVINKGDFIAVVGPSGAGKSTLMDVILGIATPDSGSVKVSELEPSNTIEKWPGAISYMPQEAFVSDTSLINNILLGYQSDEVPSEVIQEAIKKANLTDFIDGLENGLDTLVGERGSKLSGGQRQRVAIARSLLTQPDLLILDEATSALDSNSEAMITKAILELKGSTTLIVIAHRLSTVREADRVLYMEKGEILASGSFEEVRNLIPNFDQQAKLMGL